MKNLIIALIVMVPFLSHCKKDTDHYDDIRKIAWNTLTTEEKATVTIDWTKAKVEISTYNANNAYAVTFNTKDDALLGPIIVYIDASTKVVVGRGLRY